MTNQATNSNTESRKVMNASTKKLVGLHLILEGWDDWIEAGKK
jgi:hypothetical protein